MRGLQLSFDPLDDGAHGGRGRSRQVGHDGQAGGIPTRVHTRGPTLEHSVVRDTRDTRVEVAGHPPFESSDGDAQLRGFGGVAQLPSTLAGTGWRTEDLADVARTALQLLELSVGQRPEKYRD